jgi:hypothetical protein
MPARREPSHPPSDPHPSRVSGPAFGGLAGDEGPGRLQLGAALLLGLVLVASGLYMWRRPRSVDASPDDTAAASASGTAALGAIGDAGLVLGAFAPDAGGPSAVALTEPRVLNCQDRGSKTTAPDACDRLAPVERALADAINHAATCVQAGGTAGGGTIEYVADVSFSRHKVGVSLPRAGRSVHDRKAIRSCATAVRSALQAMALDSVDHQHARYKIAVTATYKGTASGG